LRIDPEGRVAAQALIAASHDLLEWAIAQVFVPFLAQVKVFPRASRMGTLVGFAPLLGIYYWSYQTEAHRMGLPLLEVEFPGDGQDHLGNAFIPQFYQF